MRARRARRRRQRHLADHGRDALLEREQFLAAERAHDLADAPRRRLREAPRGHRRDEVIGERARRREALLGVADERGGDGARDAGRQVFAERVEVPDRRVGDAVRERERVVRLEQALPGERLPHHDAEREDVAPLIERLPAKLLRREVRELALELAGLGLRGARDGAGDAEVRDARAPVEPDEHVVRRDVAVHEVERLALRILRAMGVLEPARGLHEDRQRDVERHRPGRRLRRVA